MNVTVVVPNVLKGAVDGRGQLTLGFPPAATIGDVVETLLRLYPRLSQHILDERKPSQGGLGAFLAGQPGRARDSVRLYLFMALPKRQSDLEG